MVRPRQHSDEEILETARTCFLEHGPGCSASSIARRLGLSEAALFKRFATKSELLRRALCAKFEPKWFELVAQPPSPDNPKAQLLAIAIAINGFLERLIPALWMLRASGMDPKAMFANMETPPPVKGQRLLAAWFRALDTQGRARVPSPDSVAMAFIGALHANNFFRHVVGEEFVKVDRQEYVLQVVDQFWSGIAPSKGNQP